MPDKTRKKIFLDELDPQRGRDIKEVMPECDLFCEIMMTEIEAPNLQAVIEGKETI